MNSFAFHLTFPEVAGAQQFLPMLTDPERSRIALAAATCGLMKNKPHYNKNIADCGIFVTSKTKTEEIVAEIITGSRKFLHFRAPDIRTATLQAGPRGERRGSKKLKFLAPSNM